MTKKEKFNVAVAAFDELLKNCHVYYVYMATYYERYIDELCCNLYQTWIEWCDHVNPENWICWVVDVEYNPNRLIDWHSINDQWLAWISANLNI